MLRRGALLGSFTPVARPRWLCTGLAAGRLGMRVVGAVELVVVPESIREKLGDQATRDLVELLNASARATRENVVELVVAGFERRLAQDLAALEGRMRNFFLGALGLAVAFLTFVVGVAAWFKG